jgi:hypothetical protein
LLDEDDAVRIRSKLVAFALIVLTHHAIAQDAQPQLTPAGKAFLERSLAAAKPPTFPMPSCMFYGGLCGAVRRDGSVAVPPRYDWVGAFADGRAAFRLNGLYGFVDEDGHEIVKPQYRVVGDYKFGFAQVDVDGKSGLIDRDGKIVMEPKFGFIEAIAPDRFKVSEQRQFGGRDGADDFSDVRSEPTSSGLGIVIHDTYRITSVIDLSGRQIESPTTFVKFDRNDPSIRWVLKDSLWGLTRADGSWLAEPKFEHPSSLSDGLAGVTVNGKVGFIDRTGGFVIEPAFDTAWPFYGGLGRTAAKRDGKYGVIDRTGAWVFQTDYERVNPAIQAHDYGKTLTVFGWDFKQADRWGLLNLDGHVLLEAEFDQSIQRCDDGRLEAFKNKESLYFKADGSPLQPPDGRLVNFTCGSQPPYILKNGDTFELVDAALHPVIPARFDNVIWVSHDARNVKLAGKWGRIGLDGHWLIEPKFDYLSTDQGVVVASVDGKRGFMRPDGSWLIEPEFDSAARRRDADTAFVAKAGATGVLKLSDRSWIIPPRLGVMCDINGINGGIVWQRNGERALLSPAGESWIDIGAERIGLQLGDGLLTFLKNGRWGLIDTAGQVILDPQFEEPAYFVSTLRGIAWAKRDGRWCAIDRRGHAVPGIACTDADRGNGSRHQCKIEP